MKKLALALVAALPLVFAACGDDDDDKSMTLDQTSVTLNYSAETTLKASEKKCTWESSDPFVASVDQDGVVTAEHVGTAVISAKKDGMVAQCTVTVVPTNNNFEFPIMTWGKTVDAIKAAVSAEKFNLVVNNADQLVYSSKDDADGYPFYAYLFEDNALYASQFTVTQATYAQKNLEGWVNQYFEFFSTDNENMYDIYYNANSISNATETALVGPDEDGDWYVLFIDVEDTKAAGISIEEAAAKAKAAVKAAKN